MNKQEALSILYTMRKEMTDTAEAYKEDSTAAHIFQAKAATYSQAAMIVEMIDDEEDTA